MSISRGEILDEYTGEDGRTVVMVGQEVVLLSDLASEFLACLESGPREIQVLVSRLEGVFGPPEPPLVSEEVVGTLVRDLVGRGIVRIVKPA